MFIRSARGAAYRKEKRYRIWTVVIIFFFILILIKLCITTLLFYSYAIWNFHFFTGLGPCLPNNLSTYGARRFHRSRSEWDRVFSRLTVVPGLAVQLASLAHVWTAKLMQIDLDDPWGYFLIFIKSFIRFVDKRLKKRVFDHKSRGRSWCYY